MNPKQLRRSRKGLSRNLVIGLVTPAGRRGRLRGFVDDGEQCLGRAFGFAFSAFFRGE